MASKAKASKGTKLLVGDGAEPEVFALIPEVTNIQLPDESVEEIDVTSHDSVGKETIPSANPDPGELSFDHIFIASDAKHQQLRTDLRAGTRRNYRVLLNDATLDADKTTVDFEAYVKTLPHPSAEVDGAYKVSGVVLKVTGPATYVYMEEA